MMTRRRSGTAQHPLGTRARRPTRRGATVHPNWRRPRPHCQGRDERRWPPSTESPLPWQRAERLAPMSRRDSSSWSSSPVWSSPPRAPATNRAAQAPRARGPIRRARPTIGTPVACGWREPWSWTTRTSSSLTACSGPSTRAPQRGDDWRSHRSRHAGPTPCSNERETPTAWRSKSASCTRSAEQRPSMPNGDSRAQKSCCRWPPCRTTTHRWRGAQRHGVRAPAGRRALGETWLRRGAPQRPMRYS